MRFTSASKTVAVLLASVALISACSTPVKLEEPAKIVEAKPEPVKADTREVKPQVAAEVDPLTQGALAKRSIYFDFDSYVVKEEFKATIEAHAKYLVANKGRKILVQGNTDERGGREYNIALGQKRAEAVRKALALLGVAEAQVEAVSLGEEKPKATGSDEASWAENRRSDIVYQ
ncbi:MULTISPECIES: peptidoglycan-associated lipoprotein Pal [Undibacterium]|jgi:peptidoglycan-associated lipoprotein|uniref:Peptidoglycan-associated lipoprotein n=2 Tax=Undibacterium TaxID=401469 RepID=A0A941DF04_9BURK|nr:MULTISPECIES: peptidoglycan-associated lipoprotein Pal [Undibacterium]MBR7746761.1 peptidoglycan-associated lipoprotein Pal [Undibacterium baiyunense]GGX06842.1 peptidoglycan-associated lipoprotein [Undibacterium macrobrachii]